MEELLRLQRMEATEAEVYRQLAAMQADPGNRDVLATIAADEARHEAQLAEMTGQSVEPNHRAVRAHVRRARWLGLTYAVRRMERMESDAAETYQRLGYDQMAEEESSHEEKLIALLEEDQLSYSGSIVLGISDALVELTGVLVGLTFALASLSQVALAGLVTGLAAAFSMGASEYLSAEDEGHENPLRAAVYTWGAYLCVVILLTAPYLALSLTDLPDDQWMAMAGTGLAALLILACFNHYKAVVSGDAFGPRMAKMTGIIVAVSLLSFGIGTALSAAFGLA